MSFDDINRRVAHEMRREGTGFVDALIRKLDRVAKQKRPKGIQLSSAERDVVASHYDFDSEGGWFLWEGKQLVLGPSGSLRRL